MTIVAAAQRPTFVAIAADQLWHGVSGGAQVEGHHCKIILHETLPLAVATAGFAFLGSSNTQTQDLVRSVIASLSTVDPDVVARLLESSFRDLVQDQRIAAIAAGADPAMAKLDLFVGTFSDQKSRIERLRFHADKMDRVSSTEFLSAVDSIRPFYSSGKYASDSMLFGDSETSERRLGEHLRRLLRDGIGAEAALHGGRNRQVGGNVDVAIVNADGARFLTDGRLWVLGAVSVVAAGFAGWLIRRRIVRTR